jgi:hypothetical protein
MADLTLASQDRGDCSAGLKKVNRSRGKKLSVERARHDLCFSNVASSFQTNGSTITAIADNKRFRGSSSRDFPIWQAHFRNASQIKKCRQ